MSLSSVLNEDWSDYDDRKRRGGSDKQNFACTEAWEVEYLIKKIQKHHPNLTADQIRAAIKACCNQVGAPHPRQTFVACVTKRLGL